MTTTVTYPGKEWERCSLADAGFDPEVHERARRWLDERVEDYRLVVVRGGRLVLELSRGIDRDQRLQIASATKSIYSNILGVVLAEGRIPSVDAKVYDYYPEMMDVPEGEGPKSGRYAFDKDRDITFQQLISQTSGYMKPGENPGKVFHYQTFGMNILSHALARVYGLYDTNDPVGSPGIGRLIEEKLAEPIGATWDYSLYNFDLHEKARLNIFGYFCRVHSNAIDLARLGWLRCNWGRWEDKQVVPEAWMRESVRTNPDIVSNCPKEEWKYGYGIWTNDHSQHWPDLPRDGFTASGAEGHYVTVFPHLDLVIVQNPGLYRRGKLGEMTTGNPELLKIILEALG